MNQIIAIQTSSIGAEVRETVNARELHSFLEVGKDFTTWMKDRIESFDFTENQDFIVFPEIGEKGGRPQMVYHLTLDMAKELSMVERNEKGKQARQYFIECERRAKDPFTALQDPAAMRTLLLAYSEKVIQRDKLIADMQPKVEAFHQLERADGNMNLTTAAKVLNVPPQKFNRDLEAKQWIYRMVVTGSWTGRQEKINAGYLVHKIFRQEQADGTEKARAQVLITPKGMAKLALAYNTQLQEAA